MMFSRYKKTMLLALMLTAILLLSGCVAKQDQTSSGNIGAGQTEKLPWDILTAQPLVTPSPTVEIGFSTPVIAVSDGLSPFVTPSAEPGSFVTPTLSPLGTVTPFPTALPTSTPAPSPTPLILRLGSTGQDVRAMQSRLITLGYLTGSADGDFGKASENALKAFQRRNGLTADGIAGPATLTRLRSAQAVRAARTTSPTATPRITATPRVNPNLYLKLGSTGAEVRRLQERLIALGYLGGRATGSFSAATEAAVIAFQKRNVSYYDGIAGPMTLEKLYSSSARRAAAQAAAVGVSLALGTNDSQAVRTLQRRLKDLAYYTGVIDGDFGPTTEAAVRAFQANNGLTADGKAGELTLNRLYSSNAKRAGSTTFTRNPNIPRVTPIPAPTPVINYVLVTPNPNGDYVTLRAGSMGPLVETLQKELRSRGYLTSSVDGKYGLSTVDAVKQFQEDHGLSQDGEAGPATQRVLYEGSFPIGS